MKISTRLLLYIFTLILLLFAVFGYVSVKNERYHLLNEVSLRARMLSRTLSATFKYYYKKDIYCRMKELVIAIAPMDKTDALFLNVYDKDGNLINFLCNMYTKNQFPHKSINMEKLTYGGIEKTFRIGNDSFLSVINPIRDSNGVVQGAVEVILPLRHISVILSAVIRRFLFFTIIAASLLGGAIYLISRWSISIPIKRLKEASEKLGEGDLGLRIEKSGVKELDELIDDFNRMAERLEQQYRKKEEFFKEKLRLERSLRHSEKLASIGQLTSGLAHEIGTPLNVISGRAEHLIDKLGDDRYEKENLIAIIRQTDRISETIQQLLSFSRKTAGTFKEINLGNIVNDAFSLCKLRQRKNSMDVKLILHLSADRLFGEEDGLRQLFVNLMLNSFHAIKKGGKINIETHEEFGDGRRFLNIFFEDNGPGIPSEYRARIFDPFFTTKDVGEGTGLGLFIAANIVQEHNGSIELDESCENGVRFIIRLPLGQGSGDKQYKL